MGNVIDYVAAAADEAMRYAIHWAGGDEVRTFDVMQLATYQRLEQTCRPELRELYHERWWKLYAEMQKVGPFPTFGKKE